MHLTKYSFYQVGVHFIKKSIFWLLLNYFFFLKKNNYALQEFFDSCVQNKNYCQPEMLVTICLINS